MSATTARSSDRLVACPLCRSPSVVRWQVPASPIRMCLSIACGLAFTEHQPSQAELQHHYRSMYYPTDGAAPPEKPQSDEAKFEQHLRALDTRLSLRGKRVLDVGCGSGNFLAVCRRLGVDAVGVETDVEARSMAEARGFRVATGPHEFEPSTFGLVYMNDVVEHLRSPWSFCAQLRELLAPDGSLFATTVHVASLKAHLLGSRWDILRDPTHLYFFTETSLARVLSSAGFFHPTILDFPVSFSHHWWPRRWLQDVLVATRLDSSLKIIATRGEM
jgi:2-polyprenyl-3-methyl-5-hydroxy-6-metoxy-1,4-benzoquinol methylase